MASRITRTQLTEGWQGEEQGMRVPIFLNWTKHIFGQVVFLNKTNTETAHYEREMFSHRARNLGSSISAHEFLNILFSKTRRGKDEEFEFLQN